ncbi:hypothetical protein [Amycolatopsis sp. Hca4]|uniref:hypothetical protein n=1 Tax=Amycolatopsis sp. Hca4 TaxID=2742131 RepID=UPI0015912E9C|nr:hypothetical protein [Amycolatopsis sp. Hca4]QKV74021.1 hypothetical protein HUT10_09740 [Amycolatopsis sp. Hca4]
MTEQVGSGPSRPERRVAGVHVPVNPAAALLVMRREPATGPVRGEAVASAGWVSGHSRRSSGWSGGGRPPGCPV